VGGELALNAARRLRLDGATTHTLRLLIEQHLTMVQVSQRRDLDDPEVVRQFAEQVQGVEHLDLLTLHTFADSMGTSDTLWNSFKDSLLWQLYRKAREVLRGGSEFIRAEEIQRGLLRKQVRAVLPRTFSDDEIDAHFTGLPARYFQLHDAKAVARDLTLAHRFMHLQLTEDERALEPAILWQDHPGRGYTGVHICTWDRAGLFSKLTGGLAAAGLNILAAQIYTRPDGIVLDDFFVVDARTGQLPEERVRERFEKVITDILAQGVDPRKLLAKAPRYDPLYRAVGDERMPTSITLEADPAGQRTIIDVETEDRVGLLFALSRALNKLGLDVVLAKVVTEKGAAIDSFYVREPGGAPVSDPARQAEIIARLRAAIERLDRS